MRYIWASGTDTGKVRDHNEDAVFPPESGSTTGEAILIVADGMGGAVAGEVASRLAVEAASAAPAGDPIAPEDRVVAGNQAVVLATEEDRSLAGMGTTMTLMRIDPGGPATIAHVGDSRAYLMRAGELRQVTTDHSLVGELVSLGRITEEEAKHHPSRHIITRVLGLGPVTADRIDLDLGPGDRVLLCSDGLTDMVSDVMIGEILRAGEGVEPTAWALIEQANAAGGVDNITVVVVDVTE
ncbi:MAG: serine/threonine-protein phosphatase [Acidimicrobiia bacterium]|nr:serine/threonine-protein phosphatase [Acidimicrobiia bacterium]